MRTAEHSLSTCPVCGREGLTVAVTLGACVECVRAGAPEALDAARRAHTTERARFGLPGEPPQHGDGVTCTLCANRCRMGPGEAGFCGLRRNEAGRLSVLAGGPARGLVQWYHDPLPTNCVADWVCPGGAGAGYPTYAYQDGPERGLKNLAVFYEACNFDCLFCQNWHFRERPPDRGWASAQELAAAVGQGTSCVCFFGGDPTPQLAHALAASRMALHAAKGRILRICWETNGTMSRQGLRQMTDLSLGSGGCVKFDLKAWDDHLHRALTGVSNRQTLDNFAWVAGRARERPEPPLLVASTLLVPGYVDATEVAQTARFIADLNADIPYALLGFAPQFCMSDLPTTSKQQARACMRAAAAAGLRRVRIGNEHLLGQSDA